MEEILKAKKRVQNILDTLPKNSGVYLMKDKNGKIIYVGKAKVLKNRVRQYFDTSKKIIRTKKMVSKIYDIEYIITTTENEALLLESNLIKKYSPKYNVLLKDDKNYPYLKLTNEDFPTLIIVRKRQKDNAKYFGPYAFQSVARDLIKIAQKKFKIRTKKPFKYRLRPCLNYEMKLCDAPCIGNISKKEYAKKIDELAHFLSGDFKDIIKELEEEMKKLASEKKFEKAAEIRDIIAKMQKVSVKQKISNFNYNSLDAIAFVRDDIHTAVEIFEVRNSKMEGRKRFKFKNLENLRDEEITASFLKQYYIDSLDIPNKIMIRSDFEERESLEKLLKDQAGYKVEIKVPKIGEKLKFLEMAEENAKNNLSQNNNQKNILEEIKEKLSLEELPRRIEMYDVSNISGTYTVSAMVVMEDGKINKKLTRRFNFPDMNMQNDYFVTKQTILKRMKHNLDGKKGLGDFPNIIIADGGINQIRAIKEALDILRLDIPVFGLVKNDKHSTRALIDGNKEEIKLEEQTMLTFTNMQEEVHKAAINYHRKKRENAIYASELDKIKGVGEVTKKLLLKKFGSIENIKKANLKELLSLKGISNDLAIRILNELN